MRLLRFQVESFNSAEHKLPVIYRKMISLLTYCSIFATTTGFCSNKANLFAVSYKTSNSISSYRLFTVQICAAVVVLAFLKMMS